MEFWVGLSVGMHLGKVIVDYLQKFIDAYGLLDEATLKGIKTLEETASELSSIAEEASVDD